MTDALEAALLLAGRRNTLRLVRVTIATVVGTAVTITLPDGTAVPGLQLKGLTYTASSPAVAMIAEGIVPLVFPTA